jgi:hypothetical protein
MAHGAHQGEAVSWERHVQVGEKYIKFLRHDMPERIAHVGSSHYVKPVALQSFLHHHTNSCVIIDD